MKPYPRINYEELARIEGNRLDRIIQPRRSGCNQTPMRQLAENDPAYNPAPFVKKFSTKTK